MIVSYRRIISIAVCIICVVIALAFLIFNTREHQLTEYLPQQTKLAVVYSLGESSTVGAVWQAWQDQWQAQTKTWLEKSGLQIKEISWSIDSADHEFIIMHSVKAISEKEKKKLHQTSWPVLPLTQKQSQIVIVDQKWIIISDETYQKAKSSLTLSAPLLNSDGWRLYVEDADALDPVKQWLPQEPVELLQKKLLYPAQIVWQQQNGINRLRLASGAFAQTTTRPQYIPASASLYLEGNSQMIALLDMYPEMKAFITHLLPLQSGISLQNVTQLQKPWALALENSHWWLVGDTKEMQAVLPAISSLFSYKQRVSKLPDGTAYREIIRSNPPATTTEWNGLQLQSWKLGDQGLYYWENVSSTASYLFDSLDFMPQQSMTLGKSEFLNHCAGPDREVSGIFWLKTDDFPDIMQQTEDSYSEIAMITTTGPSLSEFFLCFR